MHGKMRQYVLMLVIISQFTACSEEEPGPVENEDPPEPMVVEPNYQDTLAGTWVSVFDKTFGFQLDSLGIEFLRTPIGTGKLSQDGFGKDSVSVGENQISIFGSRFCFSTQSLPYDLANDTLTIDGLYREEEMYVKSQIGEQYFDPEPTHKLEMTVKMGDSTFNFESSPYNRVSNYSISGGYIILVAEMDDVDCFAGPKSYNSQVRYFYFVINNAFNGEGTYTLNDLQYGDRYLNRYFSGSNSGSVTITKYDKLNGILEGTFSGELTGDSGTLSIKEGYFSYLLGVIF